MENKKKTQCNGKERRVRKWIRINKEKGDTEINKRERWGAIEREREERERERQRGARERERERETETETDRQTERDRERNTKLITRAKNGVIRRAFYTN